MKLQNAIESILKEKDFAVVKNATLTRGHSKEDFRELTLADIEADDWGITVEAPELNGVVEALTAQMKEQGADWMDSEGNMGKSQ